MKWFFLTGSIIAIISVVTGWQTADWMLTFKISGIAFLVPMLGAGVFAGGFPGGGFGHEHAFRHESKEDRWQRGDWTKNLFLLALPNLIVLVILVGVAYMTTSSS
ncbi:DUF5316 family protein [Salimicrobium halophilum]|uniref:Uncharacterized protein n=1 Tax=Salimicrobium halophilum TaxID=86666 RepID=A0A1G8R2G0_9BACI|nr:DUF5316 family protein [Salimicrobium halophilum]SDJ11172.1 hypothetical protein SAMN04490247_0780 [Salimicrobium halophilum]